MALYSTVPVIVLYEAATLVPDRNVFDISIHGCGKLPHLHLPLRHPRGSSCSLYCADEHFISWGGSPLHAIQTQGMTVHLVMQLWLPCYKGEPVYSEPYDIGPSALVSIARRSAASKRSILRFERVGTGVNTRNATREVGPAKCEVLTMRIIREMNERIEKLDEWDVRSSRRP